MIESQKRCMRIKIAQLCGWSIVDTEDGRVLQNKNGIVCRADKLVMDTPIDLERHHQSKVDCESEAWAYALDARLIPDYFNDVDAIMAAYRCCGTPFKVDNLNASWGGPIMVYVNAFKQEYQGNLAETLTLALIKIHELDS